MIQNPTPTHGTNKHRLMTVLLDYAPDAAAQRVCADMVISMDADGASAEEIVKGLASALVDGLNHGNWPWVVAAMPKHGD